MCRSGQASKAALEEALECGTLLQKAGRRKGPPLVLSRATLAGRESEAVSMLTPNSPLRRQYDILAIQPFNNHSLAEVGSAFWS